MRQRGRGSARPGVARIWEGTHSTTAAELWVARRKDRKILSSLYENGKQIMQVSEIQVAGQLDKGDAIMSELGVMYALGTLAVTDLKSERDKLLLKHGFKFLPIGLASGGILDQKKAMKSKKASKSGATLQSPSSSGLKRQALKRPAAAPATTPAATSEVKEQPRRKRPTAAKAAEAVPEVKKEPHDSDSDFFKEGPPEHSAFDLAMGWYAHPACVRPSRTLEYSAL